MPKITCACNTVINLSIVPSPYGSKLLREADFDSARESLITAASSADSLRSAVWTDVLGPRNKAIMQVYVCPTCGRLYLFASASDDTPVAVWTLERGDATMLLTPQDDG
jgi:hypothetical protein